MMFVRWILKKRDTAVDNSSCGVCPLSGNYASMDMSDLPPFWLAYLSDPSDSGRIHSNIRQRWLSGASSSPTACVWLFGVGGERLSTLKALIEYWFINNQ